MNDFAIIIKTTPVFNIHKIRIFQCFGLVILYGSRLGEIRVELVTCRMCDGEIVSAAYCPFGKGVRHSMGNGLDMGSPGQDYLGPFFNDVLLLDGNHISQTLQRMPCSTLQADYRNTTVFDKLVDNKVLYILFFIGEGWESPDS